MFQLADNFLSLGDSRHFLFWLPSHWASVSSELGWKRIEKKKKENFCSIMLIIGHTHISDRGDNWSYLDTRRRRQWQPSCLENSWAEEPGRLQSMGSLRVVHNWVTSLSLFTFMHWGRKWQPTPVFLPGESQGLGSLVGCRLWGLTELDTTEAT